MNCFSLPCQNGSFVANADMPVGMKYWKQINRGIYSAYFSKKPFPDRELNMLYAYFSHHISNNIQPEYTGGFGCTSTVGSPSPLQLDMVTVPCDKQFMLPGVFCRKPSDTMLCTPRLLVHVMNSSQIHTFPPFFRTVYQRQTDWKNVTIICSRINSTGDEVLPFSIDLDTVCQFYKQSQLIILWTTIIADNVTCSKHPRNQSMLFANLVCDHGFLVEGSNCIDIATTNIHNKHDPQLKERVLFNIRRLISIHTDVYTLDVSIALSLGLKYSTDAAYFLCDDGHFILDVYHCDGVKDCYDGSDEVCIGFHSMNRTDKYIGSIMCPHNDLAFHCGNDNCINAALVCDGVEHCINGTDEQLCVLSPPVKENQIKPFKCKSGIYIPQTQVDDLFEDCPEGDDEPIYQTLLDNEHTLNMFTCPERHIPCIKNHPQCFPVSKICVYDKDDGGHLLYCRDGSHLHDCEHVLCAGMFKCPHSYCVPIHRLCNQVNDCPYGEDERNCDNFKCPGMFLCHSRLCVHPHNVCDGVKHCPIYGDDELFCDASQCPLGCTCNVYSVYCSGSNNTNSIDILMNTTKFIILQQSNIDLHQNVFKLFKNLMVLDISGNEVTSLGPSGYSHLKHAHSLVECILRINKIAALFSHSFHNLQFLSKVDLSMNPLIYVRNNAFVNVKSLSYISFRQCLLNHISPSAFPKFTTLQEFDLSNNFLQDISHLIFASFPNLSKINISRNILSDMDIRSYQSLRLTKSLVVDRGGLCCIAKYVYNCIVNSVKTEQNKCERLLLSKAVTYGMFFLSIFSLLVNVFLFKYRKQSETNIKQSELMYWLYATNVLMALYMIAVTGLDVFYNYAYSIIKTSWLKSIFCSMLYILSITSREMSLTVSFIICLERFVSIIFWKRRIILFSSKLLFRIVFFLFATLTVLSSVFIIVINMKDNDLMTKDGSCNFYSYEDKDYIFNILFLFVYDTAAMLAIVTMYFLIGEKMLSSFKKTSEARKSSSLSIKDIRVLQIKMGLGICLQIIPLQFSYIIELTQISQFHATNTGFRLFCYILPSFINPCLYDLKYK